MFKNDHDYWIQKTINLARYAASKGEIPVGALIVDPSGNVLGSGFNKREEIHSPIAHAEIIAIHKASKKLGSWRLTDCTLYVTLEPCIMCAGAIVQSRIAKVVYGTEDKKGGGVHSLYNLLEDPRLNHRCEVIAGVRREECSHQLTSFFKKLRSEKKRNGAP